MQVKLNRLIGSNALVYGDFDFDLSSHTVYQLIGKNGSGKSSIPVILEEILYNDNSRGLTKAEIPNRETGKTGWWGEVHFSIDSDEFVARKEVKSSAKLTLTKNGQDISGHTATQTYSILKEILGGLDFKAFSKLVYQSTDSSMDFLQATDANRKKFLIELLGLDGYSQIEDSLKSSKKTVSAALDSAKSKLSVIDKYLTSTQAREYQVVLTVPTIPVGLEDSIASLNSELLQAAATNKAIKEAADRNKAKDAQLARLQKAQENLSALLSKEPEPAEDVRDALKTTQKELTQVETKMAGYRADYNQFKEAAGNTHCKACGSELDVSDKAHAMQIAKQNFESLKPDRDRLRSELESLTEKTKKYEALVAWENKLALAKSEVDSLSGLDTTKEEVGEEVDITQLRNRLEINKAELNKVRKQIEDVNKFNTDVLINNAKVDEQLASLQKMKEDKVTISKEIAELTEELAELDTLCSAFGAKGIIAYKIESSVKVFEEMINHYLSEFTDGQFALGFELDSSKLAVIIYDDSVPVRMKALSSGEKNKVNVATLLAIRNMMAAISKTNINLLFLDEVISVLDQESRDTLVNILLKEEHLNSFLVSHGYTHPLTKAVRLVKRNKVSKVIHD
ncbi:DNA double-strand break repair Rad50 ATPase [Vibrio phage JSF12]|uniref:DNA double-strand break repair Rad50 ATPase n=2 Tax=Jesfedecavirus TaxID=2560156 RepID=A0A2D0YXG3_9CAUD|nr:DNA double-strand break repair Rad50 ATPase [Vibrio phage JSF10]YP_009794810.1 DNA double-strand break repair Rad50 ATPase [Vibrio phage JSF12]ASV43454.1 DNA double-strand break repair Rad50 ATPase [Vibrio phage JSF10]ASV43645.1 DNA double-strand break repair Rad50 ATPase [Vibrio phage JSF12]